MRKTEYRIHRQVWIVAFLSIVTPFTFGKAEAQCATYPLDAKNKVEVCSELKAKVKVGKTVRWTLSVPSTDKPVMLRLRNATPTVAKLRGKCAQGKVRTSGGSRNKAHCKVKMIGLGKAELRAWPHVEDPQLRSDLTAIIIAPDLARCEEAFHTHRQSLEARHLKRSGRTVYSSEAVEAVLMKGETCVLTALHDLPELVAMADWFSYRFSRARSELKKIHKASVRTDDGFRIAPAVLKEDTARAAILPARSRGKPLDEEKTDGVLDALHKALRLARNKAEGQRLRIPWLCILSTPPGADFSMHPPSYPDGLYTATTDSAVKSLSPGIYAYELQKKGERSIICRANKKGKYPCGPLNMMEDDRTTLDCDFETGCKRSQSKKTLEDCENDGK